MSLIKDGERRFHEGDREYVGDGPSIHLPRGGPAAGGVPVTWSLDDFARLAFSSKNMAERAGVEVDYSTSKKLSATRLLKAYALYSAVTHAIADGKKIFSVK